MKKLIISGVVILAVILLAVTLTGCSATFTSTLELTAQKTTLEEASSIIGVTVPVPTYLPEGYEIQEVYVQDRAVRLLISDEEIEKKLVTHTDAAGTRQRYEFQYKMEMSVRWLESGAPPVRLPVEKVSINDNWGFLQDRGDHNALWWNSRYDPEQGGMFEFVLAANKRIPKEELVKVAESVSIPVVREYPEEVIREMPRISREQAIDIATEMLPARVASVVARGNVSAEVHGWYWEIIFDNVNATYEELSPIPLKPPPPGQSASEAYPGTYQSVVISVDAQTGDPFSAGASKVPRPGPYVGQEQAVKAAREYITRIPADLAWAEKARVEAYLRGDIWVVLFWEAGSRDNRIRVSVDAVTGVATRASLG